MVFCIQEGCAPPVVALQPCLNMAHSMAHTRIPEQHEYQHLGAYLRDLRLHFRLDVAEVARRTHIRAKYIQAIEDEQLDLLPGPVYARGYIVTYAEFFGLAAEEFAQLYMAQVAGGQPLAVRDNVFFVPEAGREYAARRRGGAWLFIVALIAAVAGVGYVLNQENVRTEDEKVMDVPERLVEQLRNSVMPVAHNVECLLGQSPLACMMARKAPVLPDYLALPPILYVERDVVAPVEEDADEKTDVVPAVEEPAAPKAEKPTESVKKEEKPIEQKKPEPSKPAEKQEKKLDTKAKEDTKKPQDEPAKVEPSPFKRQGEETSPVPAAKVASQEIAPAAAVKPEAVNTEPKADAKTEKSLPSRWSDTGAPAGYSDPNEAPKEPWSPRRTR